MLHRSLFVVLVFLGVISRATAQEGAPFRTRALGAVPEGPVPSYVLTKSEGLPDWLRLGADFRTRYEDRSGLLRARPEPTELTFGVTRARVFVGIAPATFPLTFDAELMDARQFGTDFPETSLTVNELDILQLRAKLELEKAFGVPLQVELGRFSFDAMDRRLIARNRFRNTLNAFDGARIHLGRKSTGKALELMALWPTERTTEGLDRPDENRKLFGATAHVARESLVVEPYYLYYQSRSRDVTRLHTTGAHLFGRLSERVDHDLHFAIQLGSVGEKSHRAFGLHAELGRSFAVAWAPRLAAWLDYASGDSDPDDATNERFNPLFGAPHPKYGFTDLFNWHNMLNPTVGLTLRPHPSIRLSLAHRFQWLASSKDAWVRMGLIDPTGESGSFVGQELDVELVWNLSPFLQVRSQFGEFFAGSFVERTGGGTGATVFYISATVRTF